MTGGDGIEIVDPRHPLFGRRFEVISTGAGKLLGGHVLVVYRDRMLLKIPIAATVLGFRPLPAATKLTLEALEELRVLAEESGVACPSSPKTSGTGCRRRSGRRSSKTSPRSSGR